MISTQNEERHASLSQSLKPKNKKSRKYLEPSSDRFPSEIWAGLLAQQLWLEEHGGIFRLEETELSQQDISSRSTVRSSSFC
jgi:hypothetical protein